MRLAQPDRSERLSRAFRRRLTGMVLVAAACATSPVWAAASPGVLPAAAATGPAPAQAPIAPADAVGSTFRIVAFGSSSTQGVGASTPGATYPAQLQRLFDAAYHASPAVVVVNRGVGGDDIDDMTRRLKADVLVRHPDLVIWQVGSNDPLRGVPMDRFEAELKGGIDAIRATGSEVLLMEPQWSPVIEKADGQSRFVDAVRDVAAAEHVGCVKRFALMRRWIDDGQVTPEGLVGPDGLHMTDRGYALLARAVLDQISSGSQAFRQRQTLTASRHP